MSSSISASKPDSTQLNIADLDRQIVLATQSGLPLHKTPFAVIADELSVTPQLIEARFKAMLKDGRIRRIGVVPNHFRLGYIANGMAVWDILDKEIDTAGKMVGALDQVSHCYQRPRALPDWRYNLFAMVHGHTRQEVLSQITKITTMLGASVSAHDTLFSTRILKKTGLRISE